MFKTNVVKKMYHLVIRDIATDIEAIIQIKAESLESAKLKIPKGWKFVRENLPPSP